MFRVRKEFKFESAHRLSKAFSKCCTEQIHGHSYRVEVFLVSERLDDSGMVLDFGIISESVKNLFEMWDHSLVLHDTISKEEHTSLAVHNKKIILVDFNPTAENMAKFFFEYIDKLLFSSIKGRDIVLEKVRVHETATGYAEYAVGSRFISLDMGE